ncbi:MAG: quinone-dependent dihydroorotate dehydrogenase [Saprospiraceae bacterium]|nr:quinone-dependent dihydroorotate dehydrogenase [Saprospiraceae bacterium]
MFWYLLKRFFFLFDPETAHYLSMNLLNFGLKIPIVSYFLTKSFQYEHKNLLCKVDGMDFSNPVGLAAGFDKDGRWLRALQTLGFGFVEVGTVTPKAQSGNDKPRLFRLIKDASIINRMGFNNGGVEAIVKKLELFKPHKKIIIGGNIGKNKNTPNDQASEDYLICFRALHEHVDYFAINVSSPNTANLRSLQDKEPLMDLLSRLQIENKKHKNQKPIYLKIAPDLSRDQVKDVIEAATLTGIQGLILTNTTIRRPEFLKEKEQSKEAGGLSGLAIQNFSNEVLQWVKESNSKLSLIGVGGINNSKAAIEKIQLGADLIQIYSGMIFEGPWMIKNIKKELSLSDKRN